MVEHGGPALKRYKRRHLGHNHDRCGRRESRIENRESGIENRASTQEFNKMNTLTICTTSNIRRITQVGHPVRKQYLRAPEDRTHEATQVHHVRFSSSDYRETYRRQGRRRRSQCGSQCPALQRSA